ncbi:MAG: hypothetical protein QG602_2907 [Verrucomicrobiota bacterium]|nr:hypothetical protein [Verrucomicrobiota bacterium]
MKTGGFVAADLTADHGTGAQRAPLQQTSPHSAVGGGEAGLGGV